MNADFTRLQIDLLAGSIDHPDFHIHHSVFAEARDHGSCVRVERNEPVAGGDVDNPIVTAAITPVSKAAARKLPRRDGCPLAFPYAVGPDQLTGLCIESHHRTA